MITIGRLKNRITLLKPESKKDELGGREVEFQALSPIWAQLKDINPKHALITGGPAVEFIREFVIRYRKDVAKGWKIKFEDKIFLIDYIYGYDKKALVLVCREVVR